ncbi:glycosyltransferase family 39 protein [archaeon]|nr:glycosyltransferase family 39 protein [archaeon]
MESNYYIKQTKAFIKNNRLDILFIIGLFLFAFGIRAIPHENPEFKGVYGFDPTWHARMIRFVVEKGYRPTNDPIAYYPDNPPINDPPLYHYASAYSYQLYSLVATGNSGYQEDLFFEYVAFLPVIAGGIASAGMYFLGKELRNRKAGLFAGLLLAVQPSVLFRSMYGFAEEDAIGIALIIITFAFYIWALKRGTWKHGLIAGLSLLTLILTWTFSPFALAFIALMIFVNAVFLAISKNYDTLEKRTTVLASSIVPVLLIPLAAIAMNWNMKEAIVEIVKWLGFFVPLVFALMVVVYYVKYHKNEKNEEIETKLGKIDKRKAYQLTLICLLVIGLVFLAWKGQWMMDYVGFLLDTTGQVGKLMQTVGEEHGKGLEGVITEMNWMWTFFMIGLAYLPLKRLIKWKDPQNFDMVPFLFGAIPFYLYMQKAKMGYIFGPGETLLVGIVLADIIGVGEWLQDNKKVSRTTSDALKAVGILIAIALLFTQIGIGINAVERQKMNYMPQSEWTDMYDYLIKQPGKENFVMMTWWDYGHWSSWNKIKTTLDNTNRNSTKVFQTAKIFTDLRGNSSQEIEEKHLAELQSWGVSHIAIDRILLHNKWGALTFLADNNCIPNADLKKYGYSFPLLTQLSRDSLICRGSIACESGLDCTHSGEIGIIQCAKSTTVTEDGNITKVMCPLFQGPPLEFTLEEWEEIKAATWPGYDLTVNIGEYQTFKVYGQSDDTLMFFYTRIQNRILTDAPINYMLGLRWFFKDPTLRYTKLVEAPDYNVPNREVILYEVKYEGFEPTNITNFEL